MVAKIGNDPASRPWSGISKADVVFEEPVEGGITRLVAVFQCKSASLVGPVRSARAVDAQIVDELSHPLFVHVGGIDPVLSLVNSADDTNVDLGYYGSLVQNPPGKVAPYSTYFSTDDVWRLKPSDTTPPAPLFTYSTNPPPGTPVSSIDIPFSQSANASWNWSGGHWRLSYGGAPATSDGNQIAAANVVVETVQVSYGPWAENEAGGLEVRSRLTGTGQLLVLRNGEEIAGTWQRSSLSSVTTLVATDGTIIPLAPGPTWVEIVPVAVKA
ncbi:MAG: DUF3048 domain-containing protein, partial [Acidimicrobiales bacterium]